MAKIQWPQVLNLHFCNKNFVNDVNTFAIFHKFPLDEFSNIVVMWSGAPSENSTYILFRFFDVVGTALYLMFHHRLLFELNLNNPIFKLQTFRFSSIFHFFNHLFLLQKKTTQRKTTVNLKLLSTFKIKVLAATKPRDRCWFKKKGEKPFQNIFTVSIN